MLFESLTVILLWILIGWLVWQFLFEQKVVPVAYYTGLGIVTIAALLTIAIINPGGRSSETIYSLLSLIFTPLGFSLLLLSNWTLREGADPWKVWGKVASETASRAFTILLIASIPAVAYSVAGVYERDAVVNFGRGTQTAQAIVLLGQGTTRVAGVGQQRIELSESGDLITRAAQLYRNGVASRIIVSAGYRPEMNAYWIPSDKDCRNPDRPPQSTPLCRQAESSDISTLLQEMGVPAGAIVIPQQELSNRRELVDIRTSATDVRDEFGGTPNGARVALVASAINMRRAMLTFENVGFTVVPQPSNFYTLPYDAPDLPPVPWRYLSIPDLIPSVEGLRISTEVVTEFFSGVFYFLRGWMSPFRP